MEKRKKKPPTDDVAALLFGLVAILRTSGVLDRWGVSESLLLDLITWGMTGAALIRAWWRRRRPPTNTPKVIDPDTTPLDSIAEHEEILR